LASETRQPDDKPETGFDRPSPVLGGAPNYASVDTQISDIVLHRPVKRGWLFGLAISFIFVMILLYAITYLLIKGVGIWGVNVPVAWGFAIANFVWWVGIGHAGTLISAVLLLLKQKWRTSINRFAEAMTLFAVACAGLFPLIHLGRPWDFYWLIPYPNTMSLWPQFRSPLVWDFFAVSTYLTVSVLFWFLGMVPDL
jgi:Ni/Fe-hydrogenase subunit HybB-like protein